MVLPSCDHYSTHVQTLLPSGGPLLGAIVIVADCTSRPSRTRDLLLGRRVRYQFAKDVTSLARPVHTLPAQRHSATLVQPQQHCSHPLLGQTHPHPLCCQQAALQVQAKPETGAREPFSCGDNFFSLHSISSLVCNFLYHNVPLISSGQQNEQCGRCRERQRGKCTVLLDVRIQHLGSQQQEIHLSSCSSGSCLAAMMHFSIKPASVLSWYYPWLGKRSALEMDAMC